MTHIFVTIRPSPLARTVVRLSFTRNQPESPMRRLSFVLAPALFASVLAMATVAARPAAAADATADPDIQATITSQIDAFGQGDATKAESFAAPGIKTMFPDADAFLGMVKESYAPLIHPRSTHFDATVTSSMGTVQHVTVVDTQGVVWTAVYSLEKIDGRWAISGCVLVKSPETSA